MIFKRRSFIIGGIVATAAIAIAIAAFTSYNSNSGTPTYISNTVNNTNFEIFALNNTNIYGHTYADWAKEWAVWAFGIPSDKSPIKDSNGEHCAEGQKGPVWFLAGTFGGLVTRNCEIPRDKAIFVAEINNLCGEKGNPDLKTVNDLTNCAKAANEGVIQLMVTVDGKTVPESVLRHYRITTDAFDLCLPNDNVLNFPPGCGRAVNDIYGVIIKPLSPGQHDIHFLGAVPDYTTGGKNNFVTESDYRITVK